MYKANKQEVLDRMICENIKAFSGEMGKRHSEYNCQNSGNRFHIKQIGNAGVVLIVDSDRIKKLR